MTGAASAVQTPLPAEPGPGAVISFTVQFAPDGIVYTFVGSHLSGQGWALSGTPKFLRWDQVVTRMRNDYAVKLGHKPLEFFVATAWKRVSS